MPDSNKLTNDTAMEIIQKAMNATSTAEVYAAGESIPAPTNVQEKRLYSATADSVFSIGYAKYGEDWCDEVNNRLLENVGDTSSATSASDLDSLIAMLSQADQRHKQRAGETV